jgi:ferredoxin
MTQEKVGRPSLIRIVVDLNRCQAYGQCGFAAPAVFELHGESLVYDPMPPEALRGDVERAMLACPVQAIRVQYDAEPDT